MSITPSKFTAEDIAGMAAAVLVLGFSVWSAFKDKSATRATGDGIRSYDTDYPDSDFVRLDGHRHKSRRLLPPVRLQR